MIDDKQQISSVRRQVGTRTLEAGEARIATISQVFDTDIDDLWTAVTDPDRIARWVLPVSGDLRNGGKYQLDGNAGGTITRCDKPRGYDATWEFGDQASWIEVRLTEEAGGTRVQLEHIGNDAEDFWDQYGPGADGVGWDGGFFGLAGHLAEPDTALKPGKEAEVWSASAEGKEFLRLSSEAWAEVAIAAGEDAAVARRRADACTAFYTGAAQGLSGGSCRTGPWSRGGLSV